ncbi:transposase [Microbacterium luteum]|uniref:transposase n=1 Tax=Microbacterium TaxID=33882 RepID=UPI00188789D5|nr:transposase [Microbacterium luteum]
MARLLRLDEIVAVRVPSLAQETARDLVRAWEDNRGELMAARHRLSKLLLRHGIMYDGKRAWTGAHDAWLRRHRFEQPASHADYEAVQQVGARKDRLDTLIEQTAATSEYANTVTRLGCIRGISTLTAFALAVEIGDWERFTGSSIGAFTGLMPPEYSSGQSRVQGLITKTGNTHARRLLVEAAWHHREPNGPARSCRPGGRKHPGWPSPAAMPATDGRIASGTVHRPPQVEIPVTVSAGSSSSRDSPTTGGEATGSATRTCSARIGSTRSTTTRRSDTATSPTKPAGRAGG